MLNEKCALESCDNTVINNNQTCSYEHYQSINLLKKCSYCDNSRINLDNKILESCDDKECIMKYIHSILIRDSSNKVTLKNMGNEYYIMYEKNKKLEKRRKDDYSIIERLKYNKQDNKKYINNLKDKISNITRNKEKDENYIYKLEKEIYNLKRQRKNDTDSVYELEKEIHYLKDDIRKLKRKR